MDEHPNAKVVQMDTVYNSVETGPFMQTFKFTRYSFMVILYHKEKDAQAMVEGVRILERMMGTDLCSQEVEVLLTDRGSEFVKADDIETREDGSRRTRIFYCDPMQSGQKGSLENNHKEIRYICPKKVDLYDLGLRSQEDANLVSSHINSFPKENLDGKTPFEMLRFFNPELADRFIENGILEIKKDKVILKPYLLKK